MLRVRLSKLPNVCRLKSKQLLQQPTVRHNSSASSKSGSKVSLVSKLLGFTTVTTAAAAAGVTAYANYDPKFRNLIEENVPYSNVAFKYTLDLYNDRNKSSDDSGETDVSLIKKKLDRSSNDQNLSITPAKPDSTLVSKPVVSPEKQATPLESSATKPLSNEDKEIAKLERELREKEKETLQKNLALDEKISMAMEVLENQVKVAVDVTVDASEKVKWHADELNKALDKSEGEWDNVEWPNIEIFYEKKQKAVQECRNELNLLRENIEKLEEIVKQARNDSDTIINKNLIAAETAVHIALNESSKAERRLQDAYFLENSASKYKTAMQEGYEKLKEELKAISPDFHVGDIVHKGDDEMAKQELIQVVRYCMKVLGAQNKKLSKQQAQEQQKIRGAVALQKAEDDNITKSTLSLELENKTREMNISLQKKIEEVKEKCDTEHRRNLRMQLNSHIDNLQDCLKSQEKELDKKYGEITKDKVLEERSQNQKQLGESFSKLNAIEDLLRSRADLDKAAKRAKELWLACQSLKNALKIGKIDQPSSYNDAKLLVKELGAVKKAAGENDPFIHVLMHSIPDDAYSAGVYTEDALKDRFQKVERLCRRVAMIDETGGSLFKYFVSYIQSFFIFLPSVSPEEIENDTFIPVSELGTFDVISRVHSSLQQDNFVLALRYMNLLQGEPRNVAKDWIKDLRIFLETRQIADALLAHAAATSVQAYH